MRDEYDDCPLCGGSSESEDSITDLFDVFVAGFNQSAEGFNAEYARGRSEDKLRDDLRERFVEWYENQD